MKLNKKLNNKGFTLIELLAIIVILAIIMVVTIPTVLSAMDTATQKEFKNSADAIEKWVTDQYVLAVVGGGSGTAFTNICSTTGATCKASTTITLTDAKGKAFLRAAGQVPENYSSVTVQVDSTTNRACVTIKPSATGSFSGLGTTHTAKSNGCAS